MADINKKQGLQLNNLVKKITPRLFVDSSSNKKKSTKGVGQTGEKKPDWLSWLILISAFLMAGFFVLSEVGYYVQEQILQTQDIARQSNLVEYQYNVANETSTPHEVYEELRTALANNDLEGALDTIYPAYRYKYEDNLTAAYNDGNLHIFLERLTPLQEKIYDDKLSTVSYALENLPGNDSPNPLENIFREVEFIRMPNGIWKISSI